MVFSFCSHIIFPVSFYSLSMFKAVALMSLVGPVNGLPQEWFSVSFFPLIGQYFLVSLYALWVFIAENWTLSIVVTLEIWFSQSSGIVDFAFWPLELSIGDFPKYFLQSMYSLFCVVNEVFISMSLWSANDLPYLYKCRSREMEQHTDLLMCVRIKFIWSRFQEVLYETWIKVEFQMLLLYIFS